jgi:3-deoxy-D-manno-octulosonate 8-phosphate phosphatase (KDO 8-P phosphatase)
MGGAGRELPDRERLARIKLLLTDVDGVLTDGRVYFDGNGHELKIFHVHDSAGIIYWHRAGGLSGFLSGRGGRVVEDRARELGVHELHLKTVNKGTVFEDILQRRGMAAEEVAYVGDDLLDLEVLGRAGLAVSVPNGRPEARSVAHHVTAVAGGSGALREVVELLLRARGKWEDVVRKGGLP